MNQHELVDSARAHLAEAHTALVSARQLPAAERAREAGDLLASDTPATFAAREAIVAILRDAPAAEVHAALVALRAAEQRLTAALSAQHRSAG